ncbi:MAG TPA: hypothetical protein VKW70_11160 [Terriglobia bacterium]|nr:hypothetical protein [Terriglobia bacterium]
MNPARAISKMILAVVALGWMVFPGLASPQIKLYLKDGSYQLVKSYEVQGDRVRYYSVERSEWEEIPASLVDFVATRRAQTEKQVQQQKALEEARKTERETYQLPQNGGFQIAPGVRLPTTEGVYAWDGLRVITLPQSQSSLERDKKRMALNIALPGPILKSRSLVVLPGKEAAVRIFNPQPVFYAQFADGAGARIELLQIKARKNDREVEGIESSLKGKLSESRSALPLERVQLAPGLYRLKPAQELAPGEYALGEIDQNKLNLDLWDFGIDSPNNVARH